jgi:hypothetical protein
MLFLKAQALSPHRHPLRQDRQDLAIIAVAAIALWPR